MLFYSNNNAFAVRINFFKACLEKDAAYYDEHNPNEMPSLLAANLDELKSGTGSAFSQFFMMISTIFSALIIGFIIEPKLAAIFLAMFPFYMIIVGFLISNFMNGQAAITKSYAMSNGFAQQALEGIKVVQTYGQELLEEKNY